MRLPGRGATRLNNARLDSGGLAEIAGVVRELSAIESGRGLSAAEKRMLARARRMLSTPTGQ
jgi:RNA polymerase-interacting CarD/CdnL/TRCF family regulator